MNNMKLLTVQALISEPYASNIATCGKTCHD